MDESRFVPAPASSEPPDVSALRCQECGQLRRSLPRHTSACRYAGQNCPGCTYAGADHIAACPIASQLKLATDDCCDGVDLPSIGAVHSPDCRNLRPVVRASHTLPSAADLDQMAEELAIAKATETPKPTHADGCTNGGAASECDYCSPASTPAPAAMSALTNSSDLLAELLFAARDLAQSRVIPAEPGIRGICVECLAETTTATLLHNRFCKTHRVLTVLDKLCEPAPAAMAASLSVFVVDGRRGSVPENVPSFGPSIIRACQKCGALDSNWHAEKRPGDEIWLDCLGLNQCVGAGLNGKGHTLYTHRCGQIGGAQ